MAVSTCCPYSGVRCAAPGGFEDTNDAERLAGDPLNPWPVTTRLNLDNDQAVKELKSVRFANAARSLVRFIVLTAFIIAIPVVESFDLRPSAAETPAIHAQVEGIPGYVSFGVFVGTDAGGVDVGAEIDPCRMDRILGQWSLWQAKRTRVLTEFNTALKGEGGISPDCLPSAQDGDTQLGVADGVAYEHAFRSAIDRLKPGGNAPQKPGGTGQGQSILVVYISAHGTPGGGKLFLQDDSDVPGKNDNGTVSAADMKTILSGFPRGVILTFIFDGCCDGFADTLMQVKDAGTDGNPPQTLDPGHMAVLQATRPGEAAIGFQNEAGTDLGGYFTIELRGCLEESGGTGKTIADRRFGNNDDVTSSLELYLCAGPLTTLARYCTRRETKDPVNNRLGLTIADKSFGNSNGFTVRSEIDNCAFRTWRGLGPPGAPINPANSKEAIKLLIQKVKNGPDALPAKQHPTYKELGDPDIDKTIEDKDGDTISDVDEIKTLNQVTNPFKRDTDGDGLDDNVEIDRGCDPLDPDTDNDGIIDSDENPGCRTGPYTILATVQAATDGTPGSYFHCIAAINHDEGTNDLDGALQCYQDWPLLDNAAGPGGVPASGVPSRADGLAGAPPPPPYTTAAPAQLSGSFDEVNGLLIFDACFANVGGPLAPNMIWHAEVDAATLQGLVDIYGNQTLAACSAKTPNNTGPNIIKLAGVELGLARQGPDSDLDLCTDMDELLGTSLEICGDDPYNPYDSDLNFDSIGNLLVTVTRADWNEVSGTLLPGSYFHCITDTQHNESTNVLDLRVFCYIDIATVQVNTTAYPGVNGDGLPGAGPPFGFPGVDPVAFADVDENQIVLTGALDKENNLITIEGCFVDKDGAGSLGHYYWDALIDVNTGQGKVDIWLFADAVDCAAGNTGALGTPSIVGALIETVEQEPKVTPNGVQSPWDTDLDGCSDKQELTDTQLAGGLRDPYNRWDLFDAEQEFSPQSVGFLDFLAILQRFNTTDSNNTAVINRESDPITTPDAGPGIYHPRFDRGLSFIAGSNLWNEGPPDGAIGFLDFNAIVRQFNTSCA